MANIIHGSRSRTRWMDPAGGHGIGLHLKCMSAIIETSKRGTKGYYYLHTNGALMFKPEAVVDDPNVYFDSPFVYHWWRVTCSGEVEMTEAQIEEAMTVAAENAGLAGIPKCQLAQYSYDFLMGVKKNTKNPMAIIAIRAVHGAISKLKKSWGC